MTDRPTEADYPVATGADRPGPAGQDRPTATDRDRPTDRDRLVTLAEAATITGTTPEAIRSRIRRGTLRATRGNHGVWMVHRDELETGRPTATGTDRLAGNPVTPGRPPATDRPTEEATALRDRLETLTAELAGERLDRAAERLEAAERHGREVAELRERVGRAEAQGEAAAAALSVAEEARTRSDARADAAELELRETRRPWLDRLARLIRGG